MPKIPKMGGMGVFHNLLKPWQYGYQQFSYDPNNTAKVTKPINKLILNIFLTKLNFAHFSLYKLPYKTKNANCATKTVKINFFTENKVILKWKILWK